MNKKSCLALVLAVLMVASLFTGSAAKEPEAGTVTPTPTEAPTEAPVESNVSLGRMEGGVYTNSYTGYGCTLDSNWVFRTAEELQELPENIEELLADTEMGEVTAKYTQINDMAADNQTDSSFINVIYTHVPLNELLAYATMTEEQIVDTTLAQKDMMISAYAETGIQVSSMEKVVVNFLGEERVAIKTEADIQGCPYYILQIQDFQLGTYGVTLTISCFFQDNTQALLDLFYSVD